MKQLKILIIHTFGIGDFILFTPVFEELCKTYPNARFDLFVTQKGAIKPIENHSRISKIFHAPLSPTKLLPMALKLRHEKYDISITTSGTKVTKASIFVFLVGATMKIGEERGRKSLFTHATQYEPATSRTYGGWKLASLLPEFSTPYENLPGPVFVTTQSERDFAERFIQENNLQDSTVLGIHPGSNGISKFRRWPQEYYSELINTLHKEIDNLKVILFIGPDETEEGDYISTHSNVTMATGRSLGEIAALTGKCDLFFNSDSGLGHIASCFPEVHIVSIFSTADERITGVATPNRTILKKGLTCQPCNPENLPITYTCKFECLNDFTVEEIFESLKSIIQDFSSQKK